MNVRFDGGVSAQATDGEAVTITITKPDTTTETLVALTQADRSYSASATYVVAGSYSAKAHGDADGVYKAWDSVAVSFTITLALRTGTLNVTVG